MPGERPRLRLRDVRLTSAFRLTAILGSTFLIGIIALLGLIYGLTARELTRRSDYILRKEAQQWLAVPAAELRARIARGASRTIVARGLTWDNNAARVVELFRWLGVRN